MSARPGAAAPRVAGAPWTEYLLPVLLLVMAAGFTLMSSRFSPASRAVPQLVGGAMLLLCALDLVSRSGTGPGRRVMAWLNPAGLTEGTEDSGIRRRLRRQGLAVGGIAGFVLALVAAGILPAVAVFCLCALRLGAGLGWPRSLVAAAGIAGMVWVLFGVLLGLDLFPGLLLGGEW